MGNFSPAFVVYQQGRAGERGAQLKWAENLRETTLVSQLQNRVHTNMGKPDYYATLCQRWDWTEDQKLVKKFAKGPCKDGQRFLHTLANHAVSTFNLNFLCNPVIFRVLTLN